MSALSQEKPTLSSAVDLSIYENRIFTKEEEESAKKLCISQTKKALRLILRSERLRKIVEEEKLDYFSDFSWMKSFKLFITTPSGNLEISISFSTDRMFNRPIDGVSAENLPRTLEVYIPKARKFRGIEAFEDYLDDVKSFYCEHGDVEEGIEPVINDIINICEAIC